MISHDLSISTNPEKESHASRGIYKMILKPIQHKYQHPETEETILFEIPWASRPWHNHTHREPNYRTVKKQQLPAGLEKHNR